MFRESLFVGFVCGGRWVGKRGGEGGKGERGADGEI